MDSNVGIAAPVVGEIGSGVAALLAGMGGNWAPPPADWTAKVSEKRDGNIAKMRPRLQNNNVPMDYHGALGALRKNIAERPDVALVHEGDNTPDFSSTHTDTYNPRNHTDHTQEHPVRNTWG